MERPGHKAALGPDKGAGLPGSSTRCRSLRLRTLTLDGSGGGRVALQLSRELHYLTQFRGVHSTAHLIPIAQVASACVCLNLRSTSESDAEHEAGRDPRPVTEA